MNLIANKIIFSIQEEGPYDVKREDLPDLKFGTNGPIYQCIQLKIVEKKTKLAIPNGLNVKSLPKFTFVEKADKYIGEPLETQIITSKIDLIKYKWKNSGIHSDSIPQQTRFCYYNEAHETVLLDLLNKRNSTFKKDGIRMQWNAEYMRDALDNPLKVMTVAFFRII